MKKAFIYLLGSVFALIALSGAFATTRAVYWVMSDSDKVILAKDTVILKQTLWTKGETQYLLQTPQGVIMARGHLDADDKLIPQTLTNPGPGEPRQYYIIDNLAFSAFLGLVVIAFSTVISIGAFTRYR